MANWCNFIDARISAQVRSGTKMVEFLLQRMVEAARCMASSKRVLVRARNLNLLTRATLPLRGRMPASWTAAQSPCIRGRSSPGLRWAGCSCLLWRSFLQACFIPREPVRNECCLPMTAVLWKQNRAPRQSSQCGANDTFVFAPLACIDCCRAAR